MKSEPATPQVSEPTQSKDKESSIPEKQKETTVNNNRLQMFLANANKIAAQRASEMSQTSPIERTSTPNTITNAAN